MEPDLVLQWVPVPPLLTLQWLSPPGRLDPIMPDEPLPTIPAIFGPQGRPGDTVVTGVPPILDGGHF